MGQDRLLEEAQQDHPDQHGQEGPEKAMPLPEQGGEGEPAGGGEHAQAYDAKKGQGCSGPGTAIGAGPGGERRGNTDQVQGSATLHSHIPPI